MLSLIVDNHKIDTNRVVFSDGAVGYDLKDFPDGAKNVMISVDPSFKVNGLVDELSQLTFILRQVYQQAFQNAKLSIHLPYLPYGRADRKFNDKGNDGLFTFLIMLSELGIDSILVVDPHNPTAFTNYCDWLGIEWFISDQLDVFRQAIARERLTPQKEWDVIIAPDKGAKDKAKTIAAHYKLPLVCCTKERDVSTGKLSNPVVPERLDGKRVLIVDDLGDGMYTFIQLAQELYKQGATFIDLYVTHLIASKGLNVLTNSIHKVYTYQTCCGYVTMQDVYKFNRGELV